MRVVWAGALGVACAMLSSTPARAQSQGDVARADALFNAGRALLDAGQLSDACAKFAESKRLAPGIGVTLYLADCYERTGRTASAWTEFLSADGLARERSDKRADLARARAEKLEPKLVRLTIRLSPLLSRTGLEVLRDGQPVADGELGVAVPVDPGDHVVVVSTPGRTARTFEAHVGPDSATVSVEPFEDPAPAASPAASAPERASISGSRSPPAPRVASEPRSDPAVARRWVAFGLAGLGVAGVGAGGVLGLVAMSKRDQSNAPGACDATDHCTAAGLGLRRDAESAATASTFAFVAGGAALAAGVVLYALSPRHRDATTGWVLAPLPLVDGGAAVVSGRF